MGILAANDAGVMSSWSYVDLAALPEIASFYNDQNLRNRQFCNPDDWKYKQY